MGSSIEQLRPLPYHEALADYFSTAEKETWAWFASAEAQQEHLEEARLDLLRSTYRLEAAGYPELYQILAEVAAVLTPGVSVTLYQAQGMPRTNASLCSLPGEAHIVVQGNLLSLLDPMEIRGVLGHELAHHRLWTEAGGRFDIAYRLAWTTALDPRSHPSHAETARLLRLYTEIYADRGALCATGAVEPVITGLLKITTGLGTVDAAGYLRQAEEIFTRSKKRTEETSHPESFIRARAVQLWHDGAAEADAEVRRMIEGEARLDSLDLLGQAAHAAHTRRWLDLLLSRPVMQSDATRAQARLFFDGYEFPPSTHADDALLDALRDAPNSLRDYYLYLLLDFSTVDPDLEEEPIKAAHRLAHRLEWAERLEALAVKELKFKKRDAKRQREEALASTEPTPP
ncbi:MAG TPA: M48 family metalloprotease [Lacunisphaera sp.]|nr:M48 family metalloprotease [Lacunisphaera sp.]